MILPALAVMAAIKWMPSSGVAIRIPTSPSFRNRWSDSLCCKGEASVTELCC